MMTCSMPSEVATRTRRFADLVGDALDEHIRRFGLFGVDDMDVVVLLDAAGTARHTVGIEHEDEDALLKP